MKKSFTINPVMLLFLLPAPFFMTLFAASHMQQLKPWSNRFELWCRWDCLPYAYAFNDYTPNTSAYFPGFFLVLNFLHKIFSWVDPIALTISASIALTLICFWILKNLEITLYQSESSILPSILGFFPMIHFWYSGYTEPLFGVLIFSALLALIRQHWLGLSVLIGLASVTRPPGIWILGIHLITLLFLTFKESKFRLNEFLIYSFTSIIPLSVFMGWEYFHTGNPLHFLAMQKSWGRHFDILHGLKCHIPSPKIEFLGLALSWFMFSRWIRRPEIHWKWLALVTIALAEIPLYFGGFYSYSRFLTTNPGVIIGVFEMIQLKPWIRFPLLVWALTKLNIQTFKWVNGDWCG